MLLSIVMLSAKCKKDDPNGLPTATQNGSNIFGAFVNGQIFVPGGPSFSTFEKLSAVYAPVFTYYQLNIRASNIESIGGSIIFNCDSLNLKTGDQFPLVAGGSKRGISARYVYSTADYTVVAPLTGTITFTKVDKLAKILSGTFSFDAVDSKGEKVSVTDGRFDLTYH